MNPDNLLRKLNIQKPSLLIDKPRVLKNIEKMALKAKNAGISFRPHFKTHQSAEIGEWFKQHGVKAITVSSVDMAEYFVRAGWDDITIAVPVNVLEMNKINQLSKKVHLGLLVDSTETVKILENKIDNSVSIWIKVDVGYGRAGIYWNHFDELLALTKEINSCSKLKFKGLLTHSGHTYNTSAIEEIHFIYEETVSRMLAVKNILLDNKIKKCLVSIGDTPSCSLENEFKGVDEIRQGNFVFYDLMMHDLGVCKEEEIAMCVVCPVIGKYPERDQIVVYGGGIHFSKEYIVDDDDKKVFGYLTSLADNGFTGIKVNSPLISLSQEHGIIHLPFKDLEQIKIGDLVAVYPVHACLTGNLHDKYFTLEGETIGRM